jgi:epoxyqueuosine reductase QueG
MRLKEQIKVIAREHGAALVGIGSRERLKNSPPSADPDYLLPSTRSVVSFAVPTDRKAIRDFLSKKDWLPHGADRKSQYRKLYIIANRVSDFLEDCGFEVLGVDPNGVFRPEPKPTENGNRGGFSAIPDFSHRYAAVAAGLGQLGWSGNLITPQFGSAVILSSVLTSAELEEDLMLEENPCNQCKLCTTVCPVEMIGKKETESVTVAGREYTIAKKRPNSCCMLGCAGYHGLSPNRQWSSWSPYRVEYPLPEDELELAELASRVGASDPYKQGWRAKLSMREKRFDEKEPVICSCGHCGIICWENPEDRNENRRLLMESGVVVLNTDGERMAVPSEETTEVQTPFGSMKVAVPQQGYGMAEAPAKPPAASDQVRVGYVPLDREVLSSMASKRR